MPNYANESKMSWANWTKPSRTTHPCHLRLIRGVISTPSSSPMNLQTIATKRLCSRSTQAFQSSQQPKLLCWFGHGSTSSRSSRYHVSQKAPIGKNAVPLHSHHGWSLLAWSLSRTGRSSTRVWPYSTNHPSPTCRQKRCSTHHTASTPTTPR